MGLLTLMTGQAELAAAKAPSPQPGPENGGADFLSALLAAFGMSAAELKAELPGKIAPELDVALSELLGEEVEVDAAPGDAASADVARSVASTVVPSLAFAAGVESAVVGEDQATGGDVDAAPDVEVASLHTTSSANAVSAEAEDVVATETSAESDVIETDAAGTPRLDTTSAATPVAPAAAPVAPVAPAEGVGDPDPTLDNVAPALREKVERVIERMRDEFGHEVTVVEGYRSPDRQTHLYAQGRTVPGKVNTWTQRSWHSEGRAADLMVDGSYEDRMGYARLQRIAREEGLRTLGSRDLGHVELPRTRGEEVAAEVAPLTDRRFVGVAVPAAPAAVARVAPVAAPGQWVEVTPQARVESTSRGEGTPTPAPKPTPIASAETEPGEALATDTVRGEVVSATRASPRRPARRSAEGESLPGESPAVRPQLAAAAKAPVASVGAPSMLERVEQVEQVRDLASGLQSSRVSIRLDGAGSDSLRVGLLNRSVDAALDISDPATGALIRSRVAELHRALESRGLGLEQLTVNGVTAPTSGREGWLSALPEASADLLRPLFAGGSADTGRNQQDSRDRQGGERMNQGGNGSHSPRRDERSKER